MADILNFAPNAQALENVPHMLRYWADAIERDAANGTVLDLALLVLVEKGSADPRFSILGTPHDETPHPLYISGVFDACRFKMLQAAEESADD